MKFFTLGLLALCLTNGFTLQAADWGSEAEGLYEVQMSCEDRTNPNCNELNRVARLAVIVTDDLLSVSVGYPEQSISRYAFVSKAGLPDGIFNGIEASDHSFTSHFAEMQAEFSNQGNTIVVKGIIRDARFLKDITFTGEQALSLHKLKPANLNSSNSSVGTESMEGRFIARGAARQWLVNIRKMISGNGGPSFYAETTDLGSPDGKSSASGERVHLHSVDSGNTDTMSFLAPLSRKGSFLKWILWTIPDRLKSATTIKGFFYSSQGIYSHLVLERLEQK